MRDINNSGEDGVVVNNRRHFPPSVRQHSLTPSIIGARHNGTDKHCSRVHPHCRCTSSLTRFVN
jgi:hypothetical protein